MQEQIRKLKRIFVGASTKRMKKTEGEDQQTRARGEDHYCKQKGWWKRGDIKTKASPRQMACWIHAGAARNQSKAEVVELMTGNHEKDECRVALGGEAGLLDRHGSRNARRVQLSRHGARGRWS